MPAIATHRTLDITTLNDAEMNLLMDIAADPAGHFDISDDCRYAAVRQILTFHGIEITVAWDMILADTLGAPGRRGAVTGPDYEGRILARQEREIS